jgi:hypothetical protein
MMTFDEFREPSADSHDASLHLAHEGRGCVAKTLLVPMGAGGSEATVGVASKPAGVRLPGAAAPATSSEWEEISVPGDAQPARTIGNGRAGNPGIEG